MGISKELIKLGAKCELARRDFFWYCNLKAPDFYKPDRKYLVEKCILEPMYNTFRSNDFKEMIKNY